MTIYDFFKDMGNGVIIFESFLGVAAIIIVIVLLILVAKAFLTLPKSRWSDEAIGKLIVVAILIVAIKVGFIPQIKLGIKMRKEYKNNCPTVVGELKEVSVKHCQFNRGEDGYKAKFSVGESGLIFNIHSEKKNTDLVKSYEGSRVKVWYSEKYQGDEDYTDLLVYKIKVIK